MKKIQLVISVVGCLISTSWGGTPDLFSEANAAESNSSFFEGEANAAESNSSFFEGEANAVKSNIIFFEGERLSNLNLMQEILVVINRPKANQHQDHLRAVYQEGEALINLEACCKKLKFFTEILALLRAEEARLRAIASTLSN